MDYIGIYKLLALIHDNIEDSILEFIRPGVGYYDLCLYIESLIEEKMNKLEFPEKGIAFPVGINVNHCAAHDSPLSMDDPRIFTEDDVVKIDYGLQANGYILDAAFSVCFDERYRDLLETTRKACMEASKMFHPGAKIQNISRRIHSVSKDYTLLKNLCGHQIQPYRIHCGKVVPNIIVPTAGVCQEGEIYTVEPYLSTGNGEGVTYDETNRNLVSHFMFNYHEKDFTENSKFIKLIPSLYPFKTLAFHKKWLTEKDRTYLDGLVRKGLYKEYPPIYDADNKAKVAQFETTILVTDDEPIVLKKYDCVDKYIIQ
jgi:methionyl aminopeptidase